MMTHRHSVFATVSQRLDRSAPPMRLFEKAKKLGIWNPSDIDFSQDQADWASLSDDERDLVLRLVALFQAGEEAVTLDLLPLIMTIAGEGRIDEEMFLTSFLWEEAKHTDFFARFLEVVAQDSSDLSHYHSDNYKIVFYEALPAALAALRDDPSPAAQTRASCTYNMVVEGMLAETGYHAFHMMLERNNTLPGLTRGIALLKQDESRHIAYGVYLLSRLMVEDPSLWAEIDQTMNQLMRPALGVIKDIFAAYDDVPFGLQESEFIGYATMQFNKRLDRIRKARGLSLSDVQAVTQQAVDADDA
ncbi:MAG: R2-like ligand-binding oxidase [Chloroflexi bacterium]|nr:R2-like ligand-binding oxidase [Chloroflexota bacterium]